MNHRSSSRRRVAPLPLALALALTLCALCPLQAAAQVPARFYWKTLSGANAVPLIAQSISGNTNPFDSAHTVMPGANLDATLALLGYARTFSIFDRAAMVAVIEPMGRISGEVTVRGRSIDKAALGFGDPTIELDVNLIGPSAQNDLVDVLRYEPGLSVDILADLAVPIGEYDSTRPLNLGQNRWYGRLGAPIVWQLGAWVPGQRTTVEFLPAVWFFEDNHNYVGQTLSTDPIFQLDAHLTRDFTEHFWGALDAVWYYGGRATINGVAGDNLNNLGIGLTLGYQINDNLSASFSYKSTVDDKAAGDMQMDAFMLTLVAGWHPLIEGAQRLKDEK